jgi:hypothetical protein
MNPRYPVFVPTKGRWADADHLTLACLETLGVPYKAVIEAQEIENYVKAGISREKILALPHRDQGLVVTRNWIWDYAASLGVKRFWTIDDNILCKRNSWGFWRLNQNLKTPVKDGTIFYVIEDFAERYENVPICGMNYFMFASRKSKVPPFTLNTRIYSNMLIETAAPFRNEGFYNDDTDLCLRVLKAGYCTVLFNAFLLEKSTTMTVKGGMTGHYLGEGRRKMAEELAAKHPDVTTITRKWGRWQHHVDYSRFAGNKLIRRADYDVPEGVNDFGMILEIDEAREEKLRMEDAKKRVAREQEEFFSKCVNEGKTIDEALVEWRQYRDKALRINDLDTVKNN